MNKTTIILILTIVFVELSKGSFGQELKSMSKPYIEVKQSEDTLVAPDEIYLEYSLSEGNLKKYSSIYEVEKVIFKEFQLMGLNPNENLKLSFADNYISKDFLKSKTSYTTKDFELKLTDYKLINPVFKLLDSIGLIKVKLGKTNYSKVKEVSERLYFKACKNAKNKAQGMALSVDKSLGDIVFIQTENSERNFDATPYRGNYYRRIGQDVSGGLNDVDTSIELQKIRLVVTVLFRVEIH